MSCPKHTPGPWVCDPKDGVINSEYTVWSSEEKLTPSGEDTYRELIAQTIGFVIAPDGLTINAANARLIAAAPDLLLACQEAEVWLLDRIGSAATESCLPMLRAAIKKALGDHS